MKKHYQNSTIIDLGKLSPKRYQIKNNLGFEEALNDNVILIWNSCLRLFRSFNRVQINFT